MAIKKPLVMTNGQIEQLQSSDSLASVDIPQYINGEATSIVAGMAVYPSAATTVKKAKANAVGTTPCIGIVADASIAAAATGGIQVDGILALAPALWDVVTGGSGGLTPGSRYYLSDATAGSLTTTAPTSVGSYSQEVGIAMSTTELLINPRMIIKL